MPAAAGKSSITVVGAARVRQLSVDSFQRRPTLCGAASNSMCAGHRMGNSHAGGALPSTSLSSRYKQAMHEIIYLVGLVVVVMFVLGLLGLR